MAVIPITSRLWAGDYVTKFTYVEASSAADAQAKLDTEDIEVVVLVPHLDMARETLALLGCTDEEVEQIIEFAQTGVIRKD